MTYGYYGFAGPGQFVGYGSAASDIKKGKDAKSVKGAGTAATASLAVAGAAAPFAMAFPVGTAVVAGAAAAAAISGIVAAAGKSKAARQAAVKYFKKRGVKDIDEIDGWVVRAAKWSSKKRTKKAEALYKASQKKDAGLFRSESRVKLKLAVLSILENEARKAKGKKKRLVAEDASTVPETADIMGNQDAPGDDGLTASSALPWAVAGAAGLGLVGVLLWASSQQKPQGKV